jgi:lipoprotein-anchoring transpeptidase ErfK/SrfK
MIRRASALTAVIILCCGTVAEAQWPWSKPRARPTPTPAIKRAAPSKSSPPPRPVTPTPTPEPIVALPHYDQETSTRLQIFLDNNHFGPGKIDGEMGEFFRKALLAYKAAHNLPMTGAVDPIMLAEVPEVYTTYRIRPEDAQLVGNAPTRPSEQARQKWLPYETFLEFVAERFHSSQAYLQKLNPSKKLEALRVGDIIWVPNVRPFEIEHLKEAFIPENPAFAGRKVFIDTKERFLIVRENDQIICEFPITPGSSGLPAPKGSWKILGSVTLPWFRHDEGVLNYGVRTKNFHNLPPGPNNPVGVLWMGLNKPGIGVHGTNNPETIGRAGSHGCIRMANWDAARIKDFVSVGNPVEIF